MAFKILKECEECSNKCKQKVDESIWDDAKLVSCPKGNKYTKKK